MKKILILLILSVLLSCSTYDEAQPYLFNPTGGETVADGLEWYDVVVGLTVGDSGSFAGGSNISLANGNSIEEDVPGSGYFIDFIEFDDAKNYVGAAQGKIFDGQQQYIYSFGVEIKSGYTFKFSKGTGITDEQFYEAVDSNYYDGESGHLGDEVVLGESVYWDLPSHEFRFAFDDMTGYKTIAIGTVLAEIEVYKTNDMSKSLGSFFIVL